MLLVDFKRSLLRNSNPLSAWSRGKVLGSCMWRESYHLPVRSVENSQERCSPSEDSVYCMLIESVPIKLVITCPVYERPAVLR